MTDTDNKILQLIQKRFPLNCQATDYAEKTFAFIKSWLAAFADDISKKYQPTNKRYRVKFYDTDNNQCELQLGEDTLWFHLHPNLFRITPENPAYRFSYLRDDEYRSQCAIINVYNFLSDSLAEKRDDDYGILIARIFINYENHFMVEGKRQIGMLYNNITNDIMDTEKTGNLLEQIIVFCIEHDLFAQPFDQVPAMSYHEISSGSFGSNISGSKQLGFRLKTDDSTGD
ncbi:MAG: hypothetical protein JSS90_01465 [Bacteroidetes bacterium]|nr:hypothetical protein [Bacteroidota bacterium]